MPQLADSLELRCGRRIPNRIAKAALTEDLALPGVHDPTEAHVRLYGRWSDGGAGLIVTGNVMVVRDQLERTGNVVVDVNTDRDALRAWAAASTRGGNAAIVQLSHPGRQVNRYVNSKPVAPSEVEAVKVMGSFKRPRALTADEIENLRTAFAKAAKVCVECGFDGVQIHAAHGYLINQFLSPRLNRRSDRWGGDLDGRARFLREVIKACRAEVGSGAIISVKLNSADFQRGGFDEDDAQTVVGWLEQDGVDLLEISGGNYEVSAMMGAERAAADQGGQRSTRAREAYFVSFAERIRQDRNKTASAMAVMLTGGIRTRSFMSDLVDSGTVDVVGLGRPLIVEPELPSALLSEESEGSVITGITRGRGRFRAIVEAGWHGVQLLRLGAGLDPDLHLSALRGAATYLFREMSRGAALARKRRQHLARLRHTARP